VGCRPLACVSFRARRGLAAPGGRPDARPFL
jgi:hypothetical protein